MKNIFKITGIIIGTIAIIILITCTTNHYSLDAKVIEKNNTIVTFEDITGNCWEIEDTENLYNVKDNVKLTWNDKGTDFKEDDEIIKIEIK